MNYIRTSEQEDFNSAIKNTQDNIALVAKAGTGKTSSLVDACKYLPLDETILALAFNKTIADELQERLPRHAKARTLNSLGHRAFQKSLGRSRLKVDRDKVGSVLRKYCKENADLWQFWSGIAELIKQARLRGIVPEGSMGKFTPIMEDTDDNWMALIDAYDLKVPLDFDFFRQILRDLIELSFEGIIDFDDQIYMCTCFNTPIERYDTILVDECFTGDTLVSTPQGRVRIDTIKEGDDVFNSLGTGFVLKVFKSTTEELITIGLSNGNTIECTKNHPFFTEDGWKEAGALVNGEVLFTAKEVSELRRDFYSVGKESGEEISDTRDSLENSNVLFQLLLQEAHESYEEGMGSEESKQYFEANRAQASGAGRQRQGYDSSSGKIIASTRISVGRGVCGDDKEGTQERSIPQSLQDGSSTPGEKDSHRSRREGAQLSNKERAGQEEDQTTKTIRVVSLQSNEQKSPRVVYNLHISGHPSYYANGILVHNCQDLSEMQHRFIDKMMDDSTRIIVVGDHNQAIYGWRGALCDSLETMIKKYECVEMPLTVSFRCSKAIIKQAQVYVPGIKALDDAPEGEIIKADEWGADFIEEGAVIVCRNVAPLVRTAYRLIANGRPATMMGRDIGKGLVNLIKNIIKPEKQMGYRMFLQALTDWEDNEIEIARSKSQPWREDSVRDKADSIRAVQSYSKALSTQELIDAIEHLFAVGAKNKIVLCTIHKSKGFEWDTVYFLDKWRVPSKYAKEAVKKDPVAGADQMQQEHNLAYVAITRAKRKLIYIEGDKFQSEDSVGEIDFIQSKQEVEETIDHQPTVSGGVAVA